MPRLAALAALGLLALSLSGCFVFLVVPSATQPSIIGDAVITLDICASQNAPMACNRAGNSGDFANDTNAYQLMVGFRIPQTGVTPPTSFSSVSGIALTFMQSASYAAELERLQPAGSGQRWVGYISGSFTYLLAGPQTTRVQPTFALAQGADGSPFKGPLMYRPVVGSRSAGAGSGPGRPVSCGPNLFAEYTESAGPGPSPPTEICVDDPSSSDTATNLSFASEDLGILAGATGSGVQGTMATVPFSGVWSGPSDPMALFTISASTTLPGATVGVGRPVLNPPADTTTQLPVTVAIPATAAPGAYNVVVTATLSNGQVRTATGTLTVTLAPPPLPPPAPPPPPPPPPPPDNHFTLTAAVGSAADGSVDVTLAVPGAGDVDVLGTHSLAGVASLRPGHGRFAYGRAMATMTHAGKLRIVLRPSRAGRRLLAGFKVRDWALHARVWVTFTPRGGFANSQMRVVRVLKHVSYIRSH